MNLHFASSSIYGTPMTSASETLDLTEEQSQIVQTICDAKVLVTAGPGTGKTHVLIYRVAELVCNQHIAPSEVLVLSFSRAAVREIRERLREHGGDATYIRAMTFDSFATRLLSLAEPASAWQSENYDERIRRATALIVQNEDAKREATSYRHVVVDEIQDLVGERAAFVKMLLLACSGGFSLFGDPAQGIYGFQVEGEERIVGSMALYNWVRETFRGELTERSLSFNFRANTDDARIALWAWPQLNGSQPDYDRIHYQLRSDTIHLKSAGNLALAAPLLQSDELSTAILCRNNSQALVLSAELHSLGVKHRLQRRAADRSVASWIAVALRGLDCSVISRGQFQDIMDRKAETGMPSPGEMWLHLKQLERHHLPNRLDLNLVNERLRCGPIPDELSETPQAQIVVSTIHRAKGLEFERVLVVDPCSSPDDAVEVAEESRLMFVALTRARSENWYLDAPNTAFFRVRDDLDQRWVKGGYKQWFRSGIEVRGDDVDKNDPPGTFVINQRPQDVQDYLISTVNIGDEVALHCREEFIDGEARKFYAIEHNGFPVGVTSLAFGRVLYSCLKVRAGWNVNWPIRIRGLHIESIETVAGLPSSSLRAGLGGCGVWLRVRISGFGLFEYERQES
jgi:hypothetical protein